ncbi:MAG: putative metal-dependent hydrolase [Parcubacteria group bacterium Athens0714_25]|nr:MAG: putative metal-dependent hydrolase [Parcubacteria group bacterium Athens0714_25]
MNRKREIKIKDKKIDYNIRKSSRISYLRLTICDQGKLTITVPCGVGLGELEKFIYQKGDWILDKLEFFRSRRKNAKFVSSREEYLQKKSEARKIISKKADFFCQKFGFTYNKISIRNQRSRWGSCSSRGNLSFHYKLADMPERCVDYVVAHELCHLKEMNHSRKFWNLVSRITPDYKKIIKEMKSFS